MRIAVILAFLVLAGCATPYQEQSPWNGRLGVKATRLDETTMMITVNGNSATGDDLIVQYTLRKAAEETLKAGYDYFTIVASGDASRRGAVMLPGSATTNAMVSGYGNTAYGTATTTYRPPAAIPIFMPGSSATIILSKGPKPADAPRGAYDAREILRVTAPTK